MDNITKIASESLIRYITTLNQFGYKKYSSVYKIITLLAIDDLLSDRFKCMITEDDSRIIDKALDCLFASDCTIDYPEANMNLTEIVGCVK